MMEPNKKWTKSLLEELVAGKVEESLQLEYKRAASLGKDNDRRAEITKDVSAMANSAGGTLIYGIAEKDHLPILLDPVNRTEFSREWLEQVIHTIQPKIQRLSIQVVDLESTTSEVAYVVQIPQSETAHQARDFKYYKRHNFMAVPMADYEIRDVFSRRRTPRVSARFFVTPVLSEDVFKAQFLAEISNVGESVVRDLMVQVMFPLRTDTSFAVEKPVYLAEVESRWAQSFRMTPALLDRPLFPKSDILLQRKFKHGGFKWSDKNSGATMQSVDEISVALYADDMPPLKATFAPDLVWGKWCEPWI